MNYHHEIQNYSRRELLMRSGLGVGWMAASTVLQESLHANPPNLKQPDSHTSAALTLSCSCKGSHSYFCEWWPKSYRYI